MSAKAITESFTEAGGFTSKMAYLHGYLQEASVSQHMGFSMWLITDGSYRPPSEYSNSESGALYDLVSEVAYYYSHFIVFDRIRSLRRAHTQ